MQLLVVAIPSLVCCKSVCNVGKLKKIHIIIKNFCGQSTVKSGQPNPNFTSLVHDFSQSEEMFLISCKLSLTLKLRQASSQRETVQVSKFNQFVI